MTTWTQLILFALLGSIVSLLGGLFMMYSRRGGLLLQKVAVPFAAGALLAASFLDLLPEALHDGEAEPVLTWALIGFLLFFVMERFLRWFHHHHQHETGEDQANRSLIIIGDTLHNFIDGLAIGAAFLVSPATGIVATVAVAAHEIPQEIGDFGLLLSKGMSRAKVLLANIFSALATVVAAALAFGLGESLSIPTDLLLAVTAGFFIYIAAADIIPTIHQKGSARAANWQTVVLVFGVLLVGLTTNLLHKYIDTDDKHEPNEQVMHGAEDSRHESDADHDHHEETTEHKDTHQKHE